MKTVSKAVFSTATAVALFFAGQSAHAQQSEKGLKDIYANYFRIGTCYPYQQISNTQLQNVILREFNSLTHENDLKPEATMVQSGSTDNDIKVQLNSNAKAVMKFAQDNNIPIRGHTFVWHQQMPNWFFYANMSSGSGTLATAAVMSKRMESYIKNMFALIAQEYPTLKLYAYDVVNEIFLDDGKQRNPGDPSTNDDNSTWVKIYGNSSFVDSAFTYARKYAPAGCKLFYNDFNEYHTSGKRDSIVALYNRLKAKNVIDGIGMQSHLSTGWPDIGTYKAALNRFIATGAEIHVTELDLTIESGSDEAAQAEKYKSVFQALKDAREEGANITSVSVWGVIDDWSWRNSKNPLLFKTTSFTKKPAYNQVAALIPTKDQGDGKNPQFNTPKPGEATGDENGYFFYHDFEENNTQGWARRGPNETVVNSNTQKNSGSRSIYVSGRTENWNGAQFTLPSEFKAGKEYSFSVMARHEGQGTLTFKLSLQYDDADGKTQYPNIVEVEAESGKWVQLAETHYTLPAGGTGFSIYVELDNASANFYVDDAMGGIAGATIKPDGTPGTPPVKPSSSSVASSSSGGSSSSVSSSSGGSSSSRGSSSSTGSSSSRGSSSSARSSSSGGGSSSSSDDSEPSSSSGNEESSSSDGEISPIALQNYQHSSEPVLKYYNLQGQPLGNAKPKESGVYIVKNIKTGQVQKVIVK